MGRSLGPFHRFSLFRPGACVLPSPLTLPLLLTLLVGLAAVWDVGQRRIPNPLIVVGLVMGAALQTQAGGLVGLGLSVLGACAGLLALLGPFAARMVGGGDVKLLMVIGAFLGWKGALVVLLLGTVAHGLLAMGWLSVRAVRSRLGHPVSDDPRLPHAAGFFVATAVHVLGNVELF